MTQLYGPAVTQRKSTIAIFAVVSALILLSGCPEPTYKSSKLEAIKAESLRLAATHPINASRGWVEVSKSEWPPVIASLRPELVILSEDRVHILIKPFFDGGWGYEIPCDRQHLGMLPGCYSELGEGVFWHDPC